MSGSRDYCAAANWCLISAPQIVDTRNRRIENLAISVLSLLDATQEPLAGNTMELKATFIRPPNTPRKLE